MTCYLKYNRHGCETAPELADAVGCEAVRDDIPDDATHVVRWGDSLGPYSPPDVSVLNHPDAISRNVDKYESLLRMEEAVPVPPFARDPDMVGFPMLGRGTNHTRGTDIQLYLQPHDRRVVGASDYYTEYIPTQREYHVHVFDGSVLAAYEKRFDSDADPADHVPYCRNHETGWVIAQTQLPQRAATYAIDAVDALGLDMARVDMIHAASGGWYALEANTAPSLEGSNLDRYADAIREWAHVEP